MKLNQTNLKSGNIFLFCKHDLVYFQPNPCFDRKKQGKSTKILIK